MLINVNFISVVPKEIVDALKLPEVGLAEVFGMTLILFQAINVLKNLDLIGLPLPKFVKSALNNFLGNMTNESGSNVKTDAIIHQKQQAIIKKDVK